MLNFAVTRTRPALIMVPPSDRPTWIAVYAEPVDSDRTCLGFEADDNAEILRPELAESMLNKPIGDLVSEIKKRQRRRGKSHNPKVPR